MLYNILKISLIFGLASVDSADYVVVGDRNYHFSNDTLSWGKASEKCSSLGSFLATLERPSDQDIISKYMVENLPNEHYWWIFASNFKKGYFLWLKNYATVNGTWAPGQPDNYLRDEHCIHLKYSYDYHNRYEMNDWNCKQKAHYICETFGHPNDNGWGD